MTNLTEASVDPGAFPRGDSKQVKLGRYEVVRELGKGAMGIVYLAKDPLIGRLVALKTIRPAAHGDDEETKEFQQRFIREAQAAGILNHPSIVTVHDIGQDEATGTSFIAMEYVEGQNLKEVLAQGRPLGFDQIGEIIAQVAEALDFAHAKGIVHRDVKPANIILVEGNRAKITDFGIAKIISGGNLTTTGQFLGTPNYMAPEQIKGAPVDGRTDIFSLGICFYECLTRRKPFGGDSLTSISYKIVHEPFPPLQEINPQIPDGYNDIVALCLAKDPAKRYQRGRDLANALRAVVRGERPVRATDPMLNESTIVTREREKMPTIEVPFPDAGVPSASAEASPFDTNPSSAPAAQPAAVPVAARRPAGPSILRQQISPPLFLGIVALALIALAASWFLIRGQFAAPAVVDHQAELRRAKERQLRTEGNRLLSQGRADDAYTKFLELSRLAPGSPAVSTMVQRLAAAKQQAAITSQQRAEFQQKFDAGVKLYNERKYDDAAKTFEAAFLINPASVETVNFLKMSQQQADRVRTEQTARAAQRSGQTARGGPVPLQPQPAVTTRGTQPQGASTEPAKITTAFASPFDNGTIVVRVGTDLVARENLWKEERGRFAWTTRIVPRIVNVTAPLTPKNADVKVFIDVPNANIKEEHTIPRQNFLPGVTRQLIISYNQASRSFAYQLN